MAFRDSLQLSNPEYTGENRCIPCTIANAGLAVLLTVLTGYWSLPGAAVIGVGSLALIYYRGYLVPGTPTLTERYAPASVLRWFGKDKSPDVRAGLRDDTNDAPGRRYDEQLLDAGILELTPDGRDVTLSDEFAAEWEHALRDADEPSPNAVAAAFDVEKPITITETGDSCVVDGPDGRVGRWPSTASLLADTTGARVLSRHYPDVDSLPRGELGALLSTLRLFVPVCPATGGDVAFDERTVETCCRSHTILTVSCTQTGDVLLEQTVGE